MFSSHEGFLTDTMYHHRETILSNYDHDDKRQKRAHDPQLFRALKTINLNRSGFVIGQPCACQYVPHCPRKPETPTSMKKRVLSNSFQC